jgi:CheY-like chemotaxis protein
MSVLALVSDLATQSQINAAAARTGVELEIADSVEAMLARLTQAHARLVVLDLNHPGLDPQQVVPRLRTSLPSAKVVAFGPHVHHQRLAAAREAGCDLVLSRGQFHAEMDAILSGQ